MIDFQSFSQRAEQLTGTLADVFNYSEQRLDGLYFRLYGEEACQENIVIVYHGGGVNSSAGYDIFAKQLVAQGSTGVCLVDIRGHGCSEGRRGRVKVSQQIWQDVDRILQHLADIFPHAKRHLLGHSSGGGMLINYFTRYRPQQTASSLVLLAPELGPFAPPELHRVSEMPFAQVKQWPFVLNALSGGYIFSDYPAVQLNFPPDIQKQYPEFVSVYSVSMANALTPRYPQRQLAALPLPVTLLVGENDELFNAQAMCAYVEDARNGQFHCRIIPETGHLDCLFDISDALADHLARPLT